VGPDSDPFPVEVKDSPFFVLSDLPEREEI